MRYLFYIVTGLLAMAAAWRIGLDHAGQPARFVFDTPAQPLATRVPHPAGTIPFGDEPAATGTGDELFAIHCAHCHGADGSGRSYTAAQPGMPAVGNLQTTERPATELRQIMEEGRGAMPVFQRRLLPADKDNIHQYILTLKP